ncbi:MAG: alpha/beta hydrolase [Pseudomonadota bacterium]
MWQGWIAVALALAAPTVAPRTISYGNDPLQAIDVTPAGVKAPLVIFVHGGGWRRGDKAMVGAKPAFFGAHGYAFASAGYRFVPAVSVADQASDLAAAIGAVRRQAATLGIDPDRIALVGHSAGAHLAALVATDPAYLAKAGVPMRAVRAVVLLDGAGYDVPRQLADAGPLLRRTYLNAFGDDRAAQWRVSPLAHAAAPNAAAFDFRTDANRRASGEQSDALAAALVKAGAVATVTRVPDTDHMRLNRGFGTPGDPVGPAVAAFLAKHL